MTHDEKQNECYWLYFYGATPREIARKLEMSEIWAAHVIYDWERERPECMSAHLVNRRNGVHKQREQTGGHTNVGV